MNFIKYFKITNLIENHHGYQYKDGLNVLPDPFNGDPTQSCVPGGFYFTTAEFINEFYEYGTYLREVYLPISYSDFKMIKILNENNFRANKIILGKRYPLSEIETYHQFGLKLPSVVVSARQGYLNILEYLMKNQSTSKEEIDYALICAIENQRNEVIEYLIENGADIHANNDDPLRHSIFHGCLDIIKYLVDQGANIHAEDSVIRWSARWNHLTVVKYLIEKGIDVHTDNDIALRFSARNGHLEIVKYLIEQGANISAQDDYALKWSLKNGHHQISSLLEKTKFSYQFKEN